MNQVIEQLEPGKFKCFWDEAPPDQELTLNFKTFDTFVRGQYCLIHWQAKPHGLRRWGVYDGGADRYYGVDWHHLEIRAQGIIPLQVDERVIKTVPTAVLYLPDARVIPGPPFIIASVR